MTTKSLLAAAVVIALALSPSISECISAHEEGGTKRVIMWGWIILVVILALVFGEQLFAAA